MTNARFETRWHGIETGATPALQFLNTLDWRLRKEPTELLRSPADLLRWAWSTEILTLPEADQLRRWSEEHPRLAARHLSEAIELREAIAAILMAKLSGESAPTSAVAIVERVCKKAMAARTLVDANTPSLRWDWSVPDPGIERVAEMVALDAVRLLTTSEGDRVRQCADAECGWFFLDESRNRSRRWCSMESCGNRNKARRFYRRAAPSRVRNS